MQNKFAATRIIQVLFSFLLFSKCFISLVAFGTHFLKNIKELTTHKLRTLYLSRAVLVLVAITHSSPQDLSTVHWNKKKKGDDYLVIYCSRQTKGLQIVQQQPGVCTLTYQKIFAIVEIGSQWVAQVTFRQLKVFPDFTVVRHQSQIPIITDIGQLIVFSLDMGNIHVVSRWTDIFIPI